MPSFFFRVFLPTTLKQNCGGESRSQNCFKTVAVSETHSAPAGFLRDSESKVHVWVRTVAGRDSHSILLQICGQQITATDMSQNCDSEFLATDLLNVQNWPFGFAIIMYVRVHM